MIKSPINIDYGTNVHIDPSCFINRNCFIGDCPSFPITIGENTLLGPGVHIHAVTHPADWRERKGRNGPSFAGPVTIGKDCFIGSYAVIMYAVHLFCVECELMSSPGLVSRSATVASSAPPQSLLARSQHIMLLPAAQRVQCGRSVAKYQMHQDSGTSSKETDSW